MKDDLRKQIIAADIAPYASAIETCAERMNEQNLRKTTTNNYLSNLKLFFGWAVQFDNSPAVFDIGYEDYRNFLRVLTDNWHLAPRSVNTYIAALRKFRFFVQRKDWDTREIPYKKYDSSLPKVPSTEDARKLLESCETDEEKMLLMLLLSTGVRISEASSLTYGDIQRSHSKIYIRPGKGRSARLVPLDSSLLSAAEAWCRTCIANQRRKLSPSDRIFYMADGITPANSNRLRTVFGKIMKKSGLSSHGFTPHSCRHYFALQYYLQKHDLVLVKELLGHKSLNATEVYLRLAAAEIAGSDEYVNPLQLALAGKKAGGK